VDSPALNDVIGKIFPNWSALLAGSAEAVTPGLVIIIWIIAGTTCSLVLKWLRESSKHIDEARRIVADVDKESVWERRNELLDRSRKYGGVVHEAWREFDETLVDDDERLLNTVPASEFFNERTLAPKLIGNRALHAIPAILTTIGLLGTFLGLTLGLRNLSLGDTPDELRKGIQTLVDGAALGFTASLWGVITSLVVTVVERLAERSVTKRIHSLQERVDGLFEARSPEHSLSEIATSTRESSTALNVLHEKIGSVLQEQIAQISEASALTIKESIHGTLAPMMEELTKVAARQSEEVFTKVSEDLTDAFRTIGVSLAEELKSSAESMRRTLDYMGEKIAEHADAHLQQAQALHELTSRQVEMLESSLPTFVGELERAAATLAGATNGLTEITSELARSAQGLGEAGAHVTQMVDGAVSSMKELTENATGAARLVSEQQGTLLALSEKATAIAERLGEAARLISSGYEGMSAAQREFLGSLRSELDEHSRAMAGWLASYGDEVSKQTTNRMDEWNEQTRKFTSTMLNAAQALSYAVEELSTRTEGAGENGVAAR